jgi:putative transposase
VTQYDRDRHHRRSIRLRGYDYAQPGVYFVTIVTHGREMLFDDPVFCRVAETMWRRIPHHSSHVELDVWVMMPNRIHGIIVIVDDSRGTAVRPADGFVGRHRGEFRIGDRPAHQPHPQNAWCTRSAAQLLRAMHASRRIIRNERELNAVRRYILENPARWAEDRENPNRL